MINQGQAQELADEESLSTPLLENLYSKNVILGNVERGELGDPIRGWVVIRRGASDKFNTGIQVTVHTQDRILETLYANESRRDVAQSLGCDEFCGFSYWPSNTLLRSGVERLHFTIESENSELPNSPILFGANHPWEQEMKPGDLHTAVDRDAGYMWPFLVALFSPAYYSRLTSIDGANNIEILRHFAEIGLPRGFSPGPLFDAETYRYRAAEAELPQPSASEPAVLHWLRHGLKAHIVPTDLFDAKFYAATYPEVQQSGRFGFEHFITTGIYQNLKPNSWFDPQWYTETARDFPKGTPAFLHFLEQGYVTGQIPCRLLASAKLSNPTLADWALRGRATVASLTTLRQTVSENTIETLLALYVHDYYCLVAGLPEKTPALEGICHYLSVGIGRNISPTPLFDDSFYSKEYNRVTGQSVPNNACSILHWLEHGRNHVDTPTQLFSPNYYRNIYLDMRDESIDVFMHFARHGIYENRSPNFWFEPEWFSAQNFIQKSTTASAYIKFLMLGAPAPLANRLFWTICGGGIHFNIKTNSEIFGGIAEFASLVNASEARLKQLTAEQLRTIVLLFTPESYSGGGTLAKEASAIVKLTHLLAHGLESNENIGPLFSATFYCEQLAARGLTLGPDESSLLHFLTQGIELKISPMPTFDEQAYLRLNVDLHDYPSWHFMHFIMHGLNEGRLFNTRPSINVAPFYNESKLQYSRRLLFIRAADTSTGEEQPSLNETTDQVQARVMSVLTSNDFAKAVRRAQAIDPAIGDIDKVRDILVPPYHDPLWSRLRALQARLRRPHYDHIVCVPWLRSGGADLVSGYMTHALPQIFPGESVLFLRIDQPNFDRPDWLAPGVEVLDISDIMLLSQPAEAEQLLFTLIRGMRPRGVYNVNSRLCWQVMRRFGNRIGNDIKLFAYLFCWDQTANGVRVGYPSEFYSDTQACLTALLTDTQYLKDELIRTYALPQDIASRIIPVASPTRAIIPAVTMAQMGAETAYARTRPLFLWGGRIDRQKRFDLVLEIARRMPHCDFKCWGMAMLDAAPDLATLPKNVFMMGTFAHFTELPLGESDGWVFTSAWEGMPTTIIDLGILGMPIVASAVGGIPELIDDTTGWLVAPFDSVEEFVYCLNDMIQRPSERVKRATELQARTAARHSMQTYCNTLASVFHGERV